ncbi:SH3 domain-containing protein, partial [Arthrospira platensis SPKY1]|nr:SH3 domain-containing protein [Arthrospira platensis SPKY1]
MEDEPDVTTYLVTNPMFLYRGPSAATTVLDTIAPNTVMTVLQKRLPDWWYVEYGNQSGWIQPRSIRPALELPVAEQEAEELPEPMVSFTPQDYIMLDQTAMRDAPAETAPEIHRMKKWDEVVVIEKTNS